MGTSTAPLLTYRTDLTFDNESDGETLADVLVALTAGTAITYRIVELRGPGGGWPDVAFIGTEPDLRVLHERMGGDGGYDRFEYVIGREA